MTTTAISVERSSLLEFKTSVDDLLQKRDYFIQKILPKLAEEKDYYIIKGRKSLSKAGAEKLAAIYQLTALFEKDKETIESLAGVEGLVAFVCTLSRHGEIAGQGRGASVLKSHGNDVNKTIKMAQKSAFIDACIRTAALSDIFTSDLEDMDINLISPAPKSPSPKPLSDEAIPSNFWGLTDEDAFGAEVDMEQENMERENEETRQRDGEKEWRPATEKQRAFLTSLILERCADPNERERFLQEMNSAGIGEASELISSFLMAPRY